MRPSKKVFLQSRRREDIIPSPPVPGDEFVAVGIENKTLIGFARRDLSELWRARVSVELAPAYWWSADRLVMRGLDRIGMWSVPAKNIVWKAKSKLPTAKSWQDSVLTWKTLSDVEFREPETGDVQKTLRVSGPGFVCGDLLITRSADFDDPIEARESDGQIIWQRKLFTEMRALITSVEPGSRFALRQGTIPDSFVASCASCCVGCALRNGSVRWNQRGVTLASHSVLAKGQLLTLNWKRFVVIDEATGKLLCDRTHTGLQSMYHVKRGSIIGNLVVFVSESGHVAAFDIKSGDLAFLEHHRNVEFWGTAVADGRLLVSASDGNLWVYEGLA